VGLSRTALRYKRKNKESDLLIVKRMSELAGKHKRWGSPMLHMILKREGLVVNHKRTERIYYKEAKLSLKVRKRKKRASTTRLEFPEPSRPNERWSMDFIHDRLWNSRQFKGLTLIDLFTKESLAIDVDFSINGLRVSRILDRVCEERGFPESISVDNGPEFISRVLDQWAYKHKVHLDFIEPGKPIQNAHIESFNGRYRDECLNLHYFTDLQEAREITETWRIDYNTFRPHSSIHGLTPDAFATKWQEEQNQNQQPNTDKFNLQVV
jgi:putative transposase